MYVRIIRVVRVARVRAIRVTPRVLPIKFLVPMFHSKKKYDIIKYYRYERFFLKLIQLLVSVIFMIFVREQMRGKKRF